MFMIDVPKAGTQTRQLSALTGRHVDVFVMLKHLAFPDFPCALTNHTAFEAGLLPITVPGPGDLAAEARPAKHFSFPA